MLKIPPELLPFVKDYELNLVEARNNELVFHNKNNKDFFELAKILLSQKLKTKKIRQKVEDYCREQKIDGMVVRTISAALNAKINYKDVKGDYDMCTVFEEIRAEGRTEGRAEGIIQMGKKFGISNDKILNSLQEDLNISLEEAEKYLDKFSK